MSWLSDKANTDENRAKWKFQREADAQNTKDGSTIGVLRRRINMDDRITEEMNRNASEASKAEPGPILRKRDILSGSINASLMGLAALAAVAIAEPKSHDTIRAGFEKVGTTVSAVKHDLTSIGRGDIFAPAFDNE